MHLTPIARLALYFGSARTRQGILARAELEASTTTDRDLARELAAALAAELRPDGTVAGGAVPTIWRGHKLLDLGVEPGDPAVRAIVSWLMARQGKPGAYGEGCDKPRHALRACEHWIQGFFSPSPVEVRLAPITFPNGKLFRQEPAARFAASCLGLRLALRVGLHGDPGVRRHLSSLRLLAEQWNDWAGFFAPDVIVAGLHALALGGPDYRSTVERVVDLVAANQRIEGLWENADSLATLDALQATGLPEARAVVRRAAAALAERQRPDGTFSTTAQQERALIALKALRWAADEA